MCVDAVRASLAVIACSIFLWYPTECQYVERTKGMLRNKANRLTRELVIDAEMKVMAVQPFRDQYHRSLQFQLGQMMYDVRSKFKRMVFLYQRVDRDVRYGKYNHNANIPFMLEMFQLSMEVENAALMIIAWQTGKEDKEMFHSRMKSVMRSGKDLQHEAELEAIARVQKGGSPPPPTDRRKNKKWRHVSESDFT